MLESARGWRQEGKSLLYNPLLLLAVAAGLRLLFCLSLWAWAYTAGQGEPLNLIHQLFRAPDGYWYHRLSSEILQHWHTGQPLASIWIERQYLGYPTMLAGLYWLLGPSPWWGMLLNSLAFSAVGFLAWWTLLVLGQPPKRALWLALLIALWPPSLAYSAVLLKDSLYLLAIFMFLFAGVRLLQPLALSKASWPLVGTCLLAGCYLIIAIRPATVVLLALAGYGGALWTFCRSWSRSGAGPWLLRPLLMTLGLSAGLAMGWYLAPGKALSLKRPATVKTSLQTTSRPSLPACARAGLLPSLEGFLENQWRPVWQRRHDFACSGGISLSAEAHVIPSGLASQSLLFLAGLRDFLLFPYPWQRWPHSSARGLLSSAVTAQALLQYALLPGILIGLLITTRRHPQGGFLVLLWVVLTGLYLWLSLVNLGTLFRLRDVALLPALLLWSPWPYQRLSTAAISLCRRLGNAGRSRQAPL